MPIFQGSTKAVSDAITRAQNDFKGIALSTVDAMDFANEIYQIIGLATWWDWLIVTGTPFGTVANQQDYANVPADFRRMGEGMAWVNDDSSTFTPKIPLAVREQLPQSNTRGRPRAIAVMNTNFRLFPMPIITRVTSGQWAIMFDYWKMPKLLNVPADIFEFYDQDFPVFQAGFNARVADFVHDERAGQWLGRNPENQQFAGTGMWGKFAALLNNMVREEETASGSIIWAPEAEFQRY